VCVLPSSLWRLYAIAHVPDGCHGGSGTDLYVIGLSTVSFLAAFATVGLVSPRGRVLPRWVPGIGGREIQPRTALTIAVTGIALLTVVYLYAFLNPVFGWREPNDDIPGCPPPEKTDGAWLAYLAYAPILAWLPLLMLVTGDFYRRTVLQGPHSASGGPGRRGHGSPLDSAPDHGEGGAK
jgi:hypothetical protein